MKKALLFSLIFLFSTLTVIAYETIIIRFPDGENWEKAYYRKVRNEAILQYVPFGQTSSNWTRSIVVHSYNDTGYTVRNFARSEVRKMIKLNPNGKYKTLILKDNDTLFTRCTEEYNKIPAHCEFLRITRAHNRIITIQYMNRNKKDFENNYTLWLETIRGAKFLNSYWRDERTFDKSIYYEL